METLSFYDNKYDFLETEQAWLLKTLLRRTHGRPDRGLARPSIHASPRAFFSLHASFEIEQTKALSSFQVASCQV